MDCGFLPYVGFTVINSIGATLVNIYNGFPGELLHLREKGIKAKTSKLVL
jgi:hypothetical protein